MMAFRGFEGPAGSGKTHRLMEAVTLHLQENPLLPHQKVLSLTFMHGSRRRLDAEFRANPVLRGRAVAMTIDSFAHYVWHRWRSLAGMINAAIGNFNETCDACGHLLEQEAVARWVARSYPVIVVDEAQELAAPRLRMITALTGHCTVFVAADEFQSLDEDLDTTPFMEWFATGNITTLDHIHRTNKAGLLAAGANLRQLLTPGGGAGLNITYEWPNMAPFKIAAAIRNAQDTSAVLFPPGGAQWAQSLAQRLSQGLHSKRYNIPPIHLAHEARTVDEVETMLAAMGDVEGIGYQAIVNRIAQAESQPLWTPRVQASLKAAASRMGKTQWTAVELRTMIERTAANHRAYSNDRQRGIPLLSIHQAKNRQFENVIILWPPGVPGSDEFKARLLYNGITRARHNCKIFVRTQNLLNTAPLLFGA